MSQFITAVRERSSRAAIRARLFLVASAIFTRDLAKATIGVPGEMRYWWTQAHYLSPYLAAGKEVAEGDPGMVPVLTPRARAARDDYNLWRQLGIASDAVLAVIILTIVYLIAAAVL